LEIDLPDDLLRLLSEFRHSSEAIMEEFKRPWGNVPAPATIYHYTNDAGLRGILESGKVWLNDLFRMNDPSELRYGVEHAIELTKTMAKSRSPEMRFFAQHFDQIRTSGIERSAHYFIASFSRNGDELGQWRAYAGDGHGFAIGFTGNCLEQRFAAPGDPAGEGNSTFPVIYDDAQLRELQEKIVALIEPLVRSPSGKGFSESVLREYMRQLTVEFSVAIFHSALYFKHVAYQAEEEYRFLNIQRGDRPPVGALSRHRPYGLLRYIEYDWRSRAPGALTEIVIGPAADEVKSRTFVSTCLDVFGYKRGSIVVRKSPMPYRSPRR
jgi:hypothetical protein